VGFNIKEPPVVLKNGASIAELTRDDLALGSEVGLEFVFDVGDDDFDVRWDVTMFPEGRILVHVPKAALPEGSKESFVRLLEFAEEDLRCREVFVEINKDRPDRAQLIRAFMYFGFAMLPPNASSIPVDQDAVAMVYRIE